MRHINCTNESTSILKKRFEIMLDKGQIDRPEWIYTVTYTHDDIEIVYLDGTHATITYDMLNHDDIETDVFIWTKVSRVCVPKRDSNDFFLCLGFTSEYNN